MMERFNKFMAVLGWIIFVLWMLGNFGFIHFALHLGPARH